ncbi:hypothetical protein EV644_122107 [Kribbella orskensis]|uniref:Uncharacterized protein n=1 Tax=Kribbella orskensis TaxID=2512216 RepID=A0ABY2BAJ8_9ACTN|nr:MULTISPECIES: hypothetical protein [Kribbella]TCN33486.1 hypothetical protein EV642_124107 [Kribbella sp. VKM Ac-2500]TCO13632.1 hypothetical protein EV644_122107 [Kribbella orskensis]
MTTKDNEPLDHRYEDDRLLDGERPLDSDRPLDDRRPDEDRPLDAGRGLDDNQHLHDNQRLDDNQPLDDTRLVDDDRPLDANRGLEDDRPLDANRGLDDDTPLDAGRGLDDADRTADVDRSGDTGEQTPTEGLSADDPLVPTETAVDFKARWDVIQQGFVDDPRNSVTDADKLVGDVLQRLSTSFDQQHQGLESQWANGEPSTEDLRAALQRYRAFFERLLTL